MIWSQVQGCSQESSVQIFQRLQQGMRRVVILGLVLILSQSFALQGSTGSRINQIAPLQSEGLSINSQVKAFLLNLIATAFIYNGNNPAANAFYMTQKLNTSAYSGNWNVLIAVNCTYPSGYGANSYQGSWWAYWNKVNQDALDWCYYITRMPLSIVKYANQTGEAGRGAGLTDGQVETLGRLIQKGYSIYKTSQNGNAFFVSQEAATALGGFWDVLVLNTTSQFYSSAYSVTDKWQTLLGVTQLNRKYFIRKVWNQ